MTNCIFTQINVDLFAFNTDDCEFIGWSCLMNTETNLQVVMADRKRKKEIYQSSSLIQTNIYGTTSMGTTVKYFELRTSKLYMTEVDVTVVSCVNNSWRCWCRQHLILKCLFVKKNK